MLEVAEREVMESSVARGHATSGLWPALVSAGESGSVQKARETDLGLVGK